MADINNQTEYWNKVASQKTFTHPVDIPLLKTLVPLDGHILDFGCGYGRISNELSEAGFTNVVGVDTSSALVARGFTEHPDLNLLAIENASSMPVPNDSFDLVLLFAVLTCIPANPAQQELIHQLYRKLKPGSILYISDYWLQQDRSEVGAYQTLDNDPLNFGVFSLPEGASFRHHSREWISELLQKFEIIKEKKLEVFTMNGHAANAFQIIARKT